MGVLTERDRRDVFDQMEALPRADMGFSHDVGAAFQLAEVTSSSGALPRLIADDQEKTFKILREQSGSDFDFDLKSPTGPFGVGLGYRQQTLESEENRAKIDQLKAQGFDVMHGHEIIDKAKAEVDRRRRAAANVGPLEGFLGGAGALVKDPMQGPAMALGAASGTGPLATAVVEAVIGGASELVVQGGAATIETDLRERLGIEVTPGEAAGAVGIATVAGGVLGGVVGKGAQVLRAKRTARDAAAKEAEQALINGVDSPLDGTPQAARTLESKADEVAAQAESGAARGTRLTTRELVDAFDFVAARTDEPIDPDLIVLRDQLARSFDDYDTAPIDTLEGRFAQRQALQEATLALGRGEIPAPAPAFTEIFEQLGVLRRGVDEGAEAFDAATAAVRHVTRPRSARSALIEGAQHLRATGREARVDIDGDDLTFTIRDESTGGEVAATMPRAGNRVEARRLLDQIADEIGVERAPRSKNEVLAEGLEGVETQLLSMRDRLSQAEAAVSRVRNGTLLDRSKTGIVRPFKTRKGAREFGEKTFPGGTETVKVGRGFGLIEAEDPTMKAARESYNALNEESVTRQGTYDAEMAKAAELRARSEAATVAAERKPGPDVPAGEPRMDADAASSKQDADLVGDEVDDVLSEQLDADGGTFSGRAGDMVDEMKAEESYFESVKACAFGA